MAKLYVKKAHRTPKVNKQTLRELHYYKNYPIKSVAHKFTITKDLVDYFIEECRQRQIKDKKFWENHTTPDKFLRG